MYKKNNILIGLGISASFFFSGCSTTTSVPAPEPERIQPIHIQEMHELNEIKSTTHSLRSEAAMMMKENFKEIQSFGNRRTYSLSESRFDDVLNDFKRKR